jgi:hopanoid-associated phosphorylase
VSVIAVVGLPREARIVSGQSVYVVEGGGGDILRQRIEDAIERFRVETDSQNSPWPGLTRPPSGERLRAETDAAASGVIRRVDTRRLGGRVTPGHGEEGDAAALDNEISGVISIGIAGALSPSLRVGDCVIAREIVVGGKRFQTDTTWADGLAGRIPEAKSGAIAGVLQPAGDKAAKAALHLATGADAVDMESGIAAEVAASRDLPFVALRVISDDALDSLPHAALVAMKPGGGLDLGAVIGSLLTRPAQIPRLIGTARDAERAFRVLLRCRNLLGVGLGCPYLG